MLSWDGRFLHLSDHLLQSWSLIPGKLHFDVNVGLSLQFLYVFCFGTFESLTKPPGIPSAYVKPSHISGSCYRPRPPAYCYLGPRLTPGIMSWHADEGCERPELGPSAVSASVFKSLLKCASMKENTRKKRKRGILHTIHCQMPKE